MSIFVSWFPMLLLIGVWIFFMRQMQGGGRGGAFSFGKSRARMLDENTNQVTFADVAGYDKPRKTSRSWSISCATPASSRSWAAASARRADGRLARHRQRRCWLRPSPARPRCRSSASGLRFRGNVRRRGRGPRARYVRERQEARPCIIFIDEIDAVGRQRGAGLGGGNDEREQTLNQMLVEMDGFESGQGRDRHRRDQPSRRARSGAAASGPLRPPGGGAAARYPRPRSRSSRCTCARCRLSPNVDATILARGTPAFFGRRPGQPGQRGGPCSLARRNGRTVDMSDFEKAKDKIIMGAERRSIVMPEEERKNTAYHESGHAIVARMLPRPTRSTRSPSSRAAARFWA